MNLLFILHPQLFPVLNSKPFPTLLVTGFDGVSNFKYRGLEMSRGFCNPVESFDSYMKHFLLQHKAQFNDVV